MRLPKPMVGYNLPNLPMVGMKYQDSSMMLGFYQYFRILNAVKDIMARP
jgi:hypothetical protein